MTLAEASTGWYLRTDLSPQDQRDLTSYLTLLRNFFEIPDDRPVFPSPTPAAQATAHPKVVRPSRGARNRATHPWRADQPRRQP